MVKFCPTCSIVKITTEFGNNKTRKDGLQRECKSCSYNHSQKHYWAKRSPRLLENLKPGYKLCTSCNIEKPSIKFKPSKLGRFGVGSTCRPCFNIKWNKNQTQTGQNRLYQKNRKKTDPLFKIKYLLRLRLLDALKRTNVTKSHSAFKLLGCEIEFFKQYLESLFLPEFTWDNHGIVWEIDHTKPCASFNLLIEDEQQKCFHYTNLKPLFKTTEIAESFGYFDVVGNRDKGDIYI